MTTLQKIILAITCIIVSTLIGLVCAFDISVQSYDYKVTCTSVLPNSTPIIYHADEYYTHGPFWKLLLTNGEMVEIYPYTNDLKFERVPAGSLDGTE